MQPQASQHACQQCSIAYCKGESSWCAGAALHAHCGGMWRGGRDACLPPNAREARYTRVHRQGDAGVGAHWKGKAATLVDGAGGALREQPARGANTSTRAATSTWMYGKYGCMVACSRTEGQHGHPGPLGGPAEGRVNLHRDNSLLSVRHQHTVQAVAPPAGSAPSAQAAAPRL